MALINPYAEKEARDLADARIADIKNLARSLYIATAQRGVAYCAQEAFDDAQAFVEEQTKRFPKNDTLDGRIKE